MAPLRIVISNDDGVFDGIKALAMAAAVRHRVTVVCPDKAASPPAAG